MDARQAIRKLLTEAELTPDIHEHGGHKFVKPGYSRSDIVMLIDVAKLDAAWSQGTSYIGPGGTGDVIRDRYPKFIQWLEDNPDEPIKMAEVSPMENGAPFFGNGRHRFAVLRDQGMKTMPVSVRWDTKRMMKKLYGA